MFSLYLKFVVCILFRNVVLYKFSRKVRNVTDISVLIYCLTYIYKDVQQYIKTLEK